jgi:pimeloyl-ACP methyl ester carboxylesterase
MHPINYVCQGDGPPVILVHGIAASLSDWEFLSPELSSAGYCSYALDLLGHGESPKPDHDEHYHFLSLYQHLYDWIEGLQLKAPPVLIGHSLGGFLCLNYALERPMSLQGLVLINPFYSRQQLSPALRPALVNQKHPGLGYPSGAFLAADSPPNCPGLQARLAKNNPHRQDCAGYQQWIERDQAASAGHLG